MADKAKKQIDKFREAARELETDDNEARFDEKLKKVSHTAGKPLKREHSDDNKR